MQLALRFAAIALFTISGCGGGLQVTLIEAAHRRPSNVAMFFTVDTSAGQPVGGLASTSFRVYEDGELVSIDESKQTIVNQEVAAEHYTLVLVDMADRRATPIPASYRDPVCAFEGADCEVASTG